MANLKQDEIFHQQLQKLIADFHKKLEKKGYGLKLSKLTFEPMANDLVCPCGYESYIDPDTHEIKTRCKKC